MTGTCRSDEAETTARAKPTMTRAGPGRVERAGADESMLKAALERAEREAVEKVLAQANGNVAEAAAMLGILRTSLYRIMKRYGIAVPSCAGS